MNDTQQGVSQPSLIRGIPLAEEEGIGALTLGGYLVEVTERYGPNEAAVIYGADGPQRWSYDDLLAQSLSVARALLACGVVKGTRVGILMTNRFEFLSAVFGTAMAGGIATTMSTFSTREELDILLSQSACSVLLFERHILKKDFAALLTELEPGLTEGKPGDFASPTYPFLRHVAMVDQENTF